jgi:hypothetical protein
MKKVSRRVVDLSSYPDLVVMYLGMRVNAFTGIKALVGFGPKIANSVTAQLAKTIQTSSADKSFELKP